MLKLYLNLSMAAELVPTEIELPPNGGIFLERPQPEVYDTSKPLPPAAYLSKPWDYIDEAIEAAGTYRDAVASSERVRADMAALVADGDAAFSRQRKQMVDELSRLAHTGTLSDEDEAKRTEIGTELDRQNEVIKRANLYRQASAIICRGSGKLVRLILDQAPAGFYVIGRNNYWIASYGTPARESEADERPDQVLVRQDLLAERQLVVYNNSGAVKKLGLEAVSREAQVADHVTLLRDVGWEMGGEAVLSVSPGDSWLDRRLLAPLHAV